MNYRKDVLRTIYENLPNDKKGSLILLGALCMESEPLQEISRDICELYGGNFDEEKKHHERAAFIGQFASHVIDYFAASGFDPEILEQSISLLCKLFGILNVEGFLQVLWKNQDLVPPDQVHKVLQKHDSILDEMYREDAGFADAPVIKDFR